MKILVLYGEAEQKEAETWFPQGSDFTHQSIIEFQAEELKEDRLETYDVILALHAVNKLPPHLVQDVVNKIWKLLRIGGEIWLYTPAYEWCAKQSFVEQPSPLLHYQLFGTDASPNRSVFNLDWLRALILGPGFIPRVATQDKYVLKSSIGKDEKLVNMVQNVVIGWKTENKNVMAEIHESGDPTTAID